MINYPRRDLEKYFTPAWAIDALRDAEGAYLHDQKPIFDPCAGDGAILARFRCGFGIDIAPDAPHIAQGDYLTTPAPSEPYAAIVTNPPYGAGGRLAVAFIEKALDEADFVAMLLRVDFDSGATRRHLFADCPRFAVRYSLTKRLRWSNLPQADAGPSNNHAWFVWRRNASFARAGYLP